MPDEAVELRVIPCEICGGDGGWSVENTFDPFTGRIGYHDVECRGCGGTGEIEVEFRSLDIEDLDLENLDGHP